MKQRLRYALTRLLFWRRCAACQHRAEHDPELPQWWCELTRRFVPDWGGCHEWTRRHDAALRRRYLPTKLLFWRRCWWCAHSGFGMWPPQGEPIARCNLPREGRCALYVGVNDFCSQWKARRG